MSCATSPQRQGAAGSPRSTWTWVWAKAWLEDRVAILESQLESLERDVQLFGKLSRRYAEDLEVLPTYYVDEDGVHDVEKHAEHLRVRDAMIADGNSWLADEQRAVVALAEGMTTAEGRGRN